MSAGSQRVTSNSGTRRAWITQRRALREGPALPSSHPLLAPVSLKAHGPCSSSSFQATDEDSPPNNQITYSIVNASAFGSYFDISVYEGYGGTRRNEGPAWGGGSTGGNRAALHTSLRRGPFCLPDTLDHLGSCLTAPVIWSSTWHGVTFS